MFRAALSTCTIAVLLLLSPAARTDARAQHVVAPVEFNQTLLDRWLVVFPAAVSMARPDAAPMSDNQLQAYLERACAEAGFAGYEQCAEVFGYAGMILSACDRRSRSFRDPIKLMRLEIAKIEANTTLSPEQKAKATAELRRVVARFPDNIPEAHLLLMAANRDRIFEVVLKAGAGLSAQPDGRLNW
jgi:hypothetical protein